MSTMRTYQFLLNHYPKFVVEGATIGGIACLGIGLLLSFFNALFIESIGKGSMIGVTIHTIEGTIVGIVTGGVVAFLLANQNRVT